MGAEVVAAGPDDEILAEMLQQQAELALVMETNSERLARVARGIEADIPAQQAALEARERDAQFVLDYFTVRLTTLVTYALLPV